MRSKVVRGSAPFGQATHRDGRRRRPKTHHDKQQRQYRPLKPREEHYGHNTEGHLESDTPRPQEVRRSTDQTVNWQNHAADKSDVDLLDDNCLTIEDEIEDDSQNHSTRPRLNQSRQHEFQPWSIDFLNTIRGENATLLDHVGLTSSGMITLLLETDATNGPCLDCVHR